MIVGKQKPLEKIREMIADYKKVLILGCGTCVTVCFAGGEKEVGELASLLRMAEKIANKEKVFLEHTVKRQCDWEFLDEIEARVKEADAVLSLACGIGVQAVSQRFPEIPALPGLDTLFMGMPVEAGIWMEQCSGCGNCILDETGGVCPVTRCTKGLVNGPCGGTNNGKCEVDREKDCAWTLIYQSLEKQGKLDRMRKYHPPRNFQTVVRPGRLITK